MQAAQVAIMQKIIKMLTPTSPAYNNSLAFQKPTTPQEIEQILLPGDIIFSRTNSNIYEVARKYMGINYDHVAVVLNEKEVIHISPPIISKIDISFFVDPKRQPMIIRPKVENMQKFMLIINNYLGEKYNLSAIGQISIRELKAKLKNQEKKKFSVSNLKYSRICSDSVLYALTRASPSIEESIPLELQKTKFSQLGFFMPDQIAQILLSNNSEILLKSKFTSEYKIVDFCSKGGEKVVHAAQKVINMKSFCRNKIKDKMQKYIKVEKTNSKEQEQEEKPSKLSGIEIISLILGLGHTLGVVTLTNSSRFMMMMLNIVIIVGHYKEFKAYFTRNQPNL